MSFAPLFSKERPTTMKRIAALFCLLLLLLLTAFAVTIGGTAVFQAGVRLVGDADAAIYSLLEPITSIVFGLLLLGEVFTTRKAISCALILLGLLLTTLADRKKE